jgi:ABC-2 type transport system ATP-binding protein
VSLAVGPGVFGLLGPNGAGKTSLLRMLATVLPPSSGEIRLLERDPRRPAARREIRRRLGYLPQNLGYYPSFTVVEFIEYFALLKEMPSAQVPKAVAVAVERVDLGGRAKAKLRTLSGGMLRRVGIAQAIVNDPDLLLLDEPTAGLDPLMEATFRECVTEERQHGRTVLLSSHILAEAEALSDRVTIIRHGKTAETGTLAEMRHLTRISVEAELSAPATLDGMPGVHELAVTGTVVRCRVDRAALDEVVGRLHQAGIRSLTCRPPTLEELFLRHYSPERSPAGSR